MSRHLGKTLLIRLDRIGDLVLTLPIDEALRKIDASVDVQWWIPTGLSFVTENARPKRKAREIATGFDFQTFKKLLSELKNDPPKLAIVFHAPWWISLLLFLARVPVRAGPRSQWHQFLFLNRGVRQKRSRAETSELEYNFQLTERALKLGPGWLPRGSLKLQAGGGADGTPQKFGLTPKSYIVVHPGMGGSALNWPLTSYTLLLKQLADSTTVVITGTKTDEPFLRPIRQALFDDSRLVWLDGKLSGTELISILENASAVVAPSTGVLHLAASTGTPTLGLFSPVPVQKAKRWGPQGANAHVLEPKVACPGHFECIGEKCPHYFCMQSITLSDVKKTLDVMTDSPDRG